MKTPCRETVVRWLACLALYTPALAQGPEGWSLLPVPPDVSVQAVGESFELNGRPGVLYLLRGQGTLAALGQHYQQFHGAQVFASETPDSVTMVVLLEGYVLTLLQAQRQPQGFEAVALLADRARPSSQVVWAGELRSALPADSHLLSQWRTAGSSQQSAGLAGVNRVGLRANREHVVHSLTHQGWVLDASAARDDSPRAALLHFEKGDAHLTVALNDEGHYRTLVVQRFIKGAAP